MSNNLFLPQKQEITIEHNLNIAGTYTWIAPDKNRDGSDYDIEVGIYGGGGGAGKDERLNSGNQIYWRPGGNGAFVSGLLTVTPGQTYTMVVGAGGIGYSGGGFFGNGVSGSASEIETLGSNILLCGGGVRGTGTINGGANGIQGVSGDATINNTTLFTEIERVETNYINTIHSESFKRVTREIIGGTTFEQQTPTQVFAQSITRIVSGGMGGNNPTGRNGSDGKIVLRYKLKTTIIDNPPV